MATWCRMANRRSVMVISPAMRRTIAYVFRRA
jgi:hypothetical protein